MSELQVFFENAKTKARYKVLKIDEATKVITLEGPYGPFSEDYDKERFKKLGYRLVKGEPAK